MTQAQVPQEFKASIRGATASWIRGSLGSSPLSDPQKGISWWLGNLQERVPKWIGQCFSMTLPKLPATASVPLSYTCLLWLNGLNELHWLRFKRAGFYVSPVSSSTIRTINRLHGLELKVQESFSTLKDFMDQLIHRLMIPPIKNRLTFLWVQVDNTGKRGVSIYWGKCGGYEISPGTQHTWSDLAFHSHTGIQQRGQSSGGFWPRRLGDGWLWVITVKMKVMMRRKEERKKSRRMMRR